MTKTNARNSLFLLIIIILNGVTFVSGAEIIAHRGASFDAPENTKASVKLAWQQGANSVEVDVYLSQDGKIFAFHDKTPKKFGGPDRPVSGMSWSELQKLDVGLWKDEKYRGEKIPLLADLLEMTPENGKLFIEIKCGTEILPELKRLLQKTGRPAEQAVIICFSKEVVAATRKQLPDIPVYWLAQLKKRVGIKTPSIQSVIKTAKSLGITGVDLGGAVSECDIKTVCAAGLDCYIWTVNDPQKAKQLSTWGATGITTDKPALLLEKGIGQPRK